MLAITMLSDKMLKKGVEEAKFANIGGYLMKKNVGGIDKVLRLIIGFVLLLVGLFMPLSTGLRVGAFVVAAIALITAFTGF